MEANGMRKAFGIWLIFIGLLISPLLQAGPKIEHWTTANGARVYYVDAPDLPILDVRILFDAGSARDGGKAGLASLTNSMLSQGAGEWSNNQISERLASVGAELGSGSLRDMAWVSVRTLTREPAQETALSTLQAILNQPTFPEDQVERLRKSTLVGLRQDEQNPSSVASKTLYRELYGAHPYASDPSGTEESVSGLTLGDLKDYYAKHYVAKNAVVAIVGAIGRPEAETIADRLIGRLPEGEAAPAVPEVGKAAKTGMHQVDFPSSQSHLLVAQPGIRRGDPDYFPLYVGNHILGGSGLVSLLAEEVREKRGLSYSVYSYFLLMRQPGPFQMGLQTKNSQAELALNVLMQTLGDFMEKGPTEKQLTAAKQNITGGFPLRTASNSDIVEYIGMIGFYGLPLDYLDQFVGKIEAVTAEQIKDAFQRRVDPKGFLTVVVGSPAGDAAAAN